MTLNQNKKLKSRHLTMMAMGGSIGTGLFLTLGQIVSFAGVGGALLAYIISGLIVYFLMQSLSDLSSKFPSSASFCDHGKRFIHPSVGFALGWNYWLNWTITVAFELSSVCVLLQFWFPDITLIQAIIPCFLLVLFINLLPVSGFGEVEYYISIIKVLTIILFLFLGVYNIFYLYFICKQNIYDIFKVWFSGNLFKNGFIGLIKACVFASFAFQGTEMIGIAAGETEDPKHDIPKATNNIFWRIFIFYIGSNFTITTLNLSQASDETVITSPFTKLFVNLLGNYSAGFVNFIILSAVFSSANSGLYASSRMLKGLSDNNMAPSWLSRLNSFNIPLNAILTTFLSSVFLFYASYLIDSNSLNYFLIESSSLAGIIAWVGIVWAHYNYVKAVKYHSKYIVTDYNFISSYFPLKQILSILFCIVTIFGVAVFNSIDSNYFGIINIFINLTLLWVVILLFLLHRFFNKTKFITIETIQVYND